MQRWLKEEKKGSLNATLKHTQAANSNLLSFLKDQLSYAGRCLIGGAEGSAPVLKLNRGKKELAKVLNPSETIWWFEGGMEEWWQRGLRVGTVRCNESTAWFYFGKYLAQHFRSSLA